jgi:hypothetical protein
MTSGPRLSAATGMGARRWVGNDATGRLGQAATLGCNGRARPKKRRGADRLGQLGWAKGKEGLKRGLAIFEKTQNK